MDAPDAERKATLITGGNVLTPFESLPGGDVLIRDGKIAAVGGDLSSQMLKDADRIDATGCTVAPGFVDLHTQGMGGYDVWSGTAEALAGWSLAQAQHGTTSFQITTSYQSEGYDFLVSQLANAADVFPGAEPIGVYLEGPFCSLEKRGAVGESAIMPITIALLDEIQQSLGEHLHMMTVAPERKAGLEMIAELRKRGVLAAIGHTACDYDTAVKAVDAGARHVTHCFNAMASIQHREPGPLVVVLTDERVTVELICDGIHLHPAIVDMAVRLKGAGTACAVTDSVRVAGLASADGELVFGNGGPTYTVKDGAVTLPGGTLAGSTLTMDRALANVMRFARLSLKDALPMLTATPAKATHVDDHKGQIKPGFDADVVIFGDDVSVQRTIVRGRTVYQHDAS